jgi:hypothetical protein
MVRNTRNDGKQRLRERALINLLRLTDLPNLSPFMASLGPSGHIEAVHRDSRPGKRKVAPTLVSKRETIKWLPPPVLLAQLAAQLAQLAKV